MGQLFSLVALYMLAGVGILTLVGIIVGLYLCWRYEIHINIHGKEEKK